MIQQNISFGLCFNQTCDITFIVLHLNLDAHLMLLGACVWQALLPQPPWRPIQHQTGPKLGGRHHCPFAVPVPPYQSIIHTVGESSSASVAG